MNYRETLSWLYSQLPMYQRIGGAAYKDNLDNTIALCNLLGSPQNYFDSVHVAGTNGKGSVSHLLASIFQEHGYKTGLYTSPHLKDFRERIRVNGQPIPKRNVTTFVRRYQKAFEQIRPSFFEMTVALAFDHFREEEVDMAVVEVGMGGRLDSTNVITPLVSVITNISFDHMQYLGNSLEKIAVEKAGIIKPGIPVVIGETQPETEKVFREKAGSVGAPIWFADQMRVDKRTNGQADKRTNAYNTVKGYLASRSETEIARPRDGFRLPLQGWYQRKNLNTALAVIDVLNFPSSGISHQTSDIKPQTIRQGVANVINNTGLRGRWQILREKPLTVCDTGHNEAGIREVVAQLKQTPHHILHMVIGTVSDKDINKILPLLPRDALYYFCKADIPRGLDALELRRQAAAFGLHGQAYNSVREAHKAAKRSAGQDDLIYIGGSTFVVAEVL